MDNNALPTLTEEAALDWGLFYLSPSQSPWQGDLKGVYNTLKDAQDQVTVKKWSGGRLSWVEPTEFVFNGVSADGKAFEIRTRKK